MYIHSWHSTDVCVHKESILMYPQLLARLAIKSRLWGVACYKICTLLCTEEDSFVSSKAFRHRSRNITWGMAAWAAGYYTELQGWLVNIDRPIPIMFCTNERRGVASHPIHLLDQPLPFVYIYPVLIFVSEWEPSNHKNIEWVHAHNDKSDPLEKYFILE